MTFTECYIILTVKREAISNVLNMLKDSTYVKEIILGAGSVDMIVKVEAQNYEEVVNNVWYPLYKSKDVINAFILMPTCKILRNEKGEFCEEWLIK